MLDVRYNERRKRGTDAFPIAYYHEFTSKAGYFLPLHWHIEHEILHVLKGIYPLFIDGKEYELQPGDVCFIQNGILHGDGSKKPDCEYESVVFDLNIIRNRAFDNDEFLMKMEKHIIRVKPFVNENSTDKLYVADVMPVFKYMREQSPGFKFEVCGSLMRFFARIQRDHLYSEIPVSSTSSLYVRSHRRIDQLERVFEFIKQNYNTKFTLTELSGVAGMSPKYFCKVFKSMTNHSPMEYVNVYRIEQASYYIKKEETSIIEIAMACGFNDFSYFIKIFKKYRGITPYQYRKQA
ncbi:MAG: hypothetical protein BKP49_11210 [Treponema sp. CETP13]|nr:MAG: hypothetical protein BKP49_11210 [Treponema sp. CETP13]